MTASQKTNVDSDSYREDWRSVARYTVRYQGLFFEGQSHVKIAYATGLTYDEAGKRECEERKLMVAQGLKGHILLDLEHPDETRAEYKKIRAAREARENYMPSHIAAAMAA
jgi:hypothetical protein